MKLIKLNEEHYVIVDDSEIKEGDWVLTEEKNIHQVDYVDAYTKINEWKKITHSTQPIEEFVDNEGIKRIGWTNIKVLELSEVKELIGEVDVEKKAESYKNKKGSIPTTKLEDEIFKLGYKDGYNQSLEDNKEKKYTEEDLKYMFECGRNYQNNAEITFKVSMEYLQPKTEWEVEFVNGKLKLL